MEGQETLADMWERFWAHAPQGTPKAMHTHMRRAFYAGTFCMLATSFETVEEMDEVLAQAYIGELVAEMERFKDAVKRGEA